MCILFAHAAIVSIYTEKLQTLSLPVESNVLRGSFYIVCIFFFFSFGSVVLHAGYYFPNQGSNQCPLQ